MTESRPIPEDRRSALDAMRLELVRPSRLADEIADRLRAYIVANKLEPGTRLPSERRLAEQLGTSRATISQALRTLSIAGLVRVRHGSGAYVMEHPDELLGVSFDLMFPGDVTAVTDLARLGYWIEQTLLREDPPPAFDPEKLQQAYDELEQASGDVTTFVEADARFHTAVIEATSNRYLIALFEKVHRMILTISYTDWVEWEKTPAWLEGLYDESLELHKGILDAAIDGDMSALDRALAKHHRTVVEHVTAATAARS